jgi:tetratricopeptide (TPR) repeat protein
MKTIISTFWIYFLLASLFSSPAGGKRGISVTPQEGRSARMSNKLIALVIGIDDYIHFPPLEAAVADARYVKQHLEKKGYKVISIENRQATKSNIIDKLEHFQAQNYHKFLFFFAGHGHTKQSGHTKKGYIIPINARKSNFDNYAISMNKLKAIVNDFKATHSLLVFDCCYSGLALTRSGFSDPEISGYLERVDKMRSCQVLTAGQMGDQASELEGHGLFTRYFVKALEGEADANQDNVITTTEICEWLRPLVYDLSNQSQIPMYGRLFGEGEYLFKLRDSKARIRVQQSWIENSKKIYRQIGKHTSSFSIAYNRDTPLLRRISGQLNCGLPEVKSFIQNTINYQAKPGRYMEIRKRAPRKDRKQSNKYNDIGVRTYKKYRKTDNQVLLDQAIDHYYNAIRYNLENASALSNLSLAYRRKAMYRKAIWAGLESIRLTDKKSTLAASLFNIGACYTEVGKHDAALVFYLSALSLREKGTITYNITQEKIDNAYHRIAEQ